MEDSSGWPATPPVCSHLCHVCRGRGTGCVSLDEDGMWQNTAYMHEKNRPSLK